MYSCSSDFGVFGDGDIVSATFGEAGDVDGLVEAAEFTDFLRYLPNQLIISRFFFCAVFSYICQQNTKNWI